MIQTIAEMLQYQYTTMRHYPLILSQWVITEQVTFSIVFPNGVVVWFPTEAADGVVDHLRTLSFSNCYECINMKLLRSTTW